jgi:aminoglycoside/choline kinase family phosphotransferase
MPESANSLPADDLRRERGFTWALQALGLTQPRLDMIAGDASFRRYFRLQEGGHSWVLMDAPPEKENSQPFVDVAERLQHGGVHAPRILAQDLQQGYLLLEDFGDLLLRDELTTNNADHWYSILLELLARLAGEVDASGLPAYNRERLVTELELFTTWYLERHMGLTLSCEDWDVWEALCTRLIASAMEQPRVFVHRDFHSCNLLVSPGDSLGVIDFQDAVRGPLTYDLASLLWDRYIPWPRSRLQGWMEDFRLQVSPASDPVVWQRWCDWMGLQRNLKIVGIFARLHYRDGKTGYLEMIPRFWGYLMDVLPCYDETREFHALLERLQCAP